MIMPTLSPKYGLNPCIPKCLYCGEMKNEIRLFGRVRSKKYSRDDIQMPMSEILDTIPCEECAKKFSAGVLCTEVLPCKTEEEKQHPIPTGRYFVVKPDMFKGRFVAGQLVHIPTGVFSEIFGKVIEDMEKGEENA